MKKNKKDLDILKELYGPTPLGSPEEEAQKSIDRIFSNNKDENTTISTATVVTQDELNRTMSFPQMSRDNKGKIELSYNLYGKEANEEEAKVWMFGGNKYGRASWLKGYKYSIVMDSLMRHLTKFANGEDIDEESGLRHTGHIMANAKILAQMDITRKDLDDRSING